MSPTDRSEASDQRRRRCDRKTPRDCTLTSIRARQYGSCLPDASTFLLFAAASLLFLAIPGPSVFYIVTRSLASAARRRLDRLSGSVFVGLGLAAALAGEPRHK